MGKKKQKQARPIVTDVSAVKNAAGEYVVSRSYAEVVDLLSEGVIDGLTSGNYKYEGKENATGYNTQTFTQYQATGSNLQNKDSLGFLQSIYWNEIPVVDKDGFYNFPSINLQKVDGDPQGAIPKLNTEMNMYAGVTSSDLLDLTLNRSIGERLYGPEIQGGDAAPTSEKVAQLKPGVKIDKYAKTYMILNREIQKILVHVKVSALFENLQAGPKTYKKSKYLNACNSASSGYGDTKARTVTYNIYYRPIFDPRFKPSDSTGTVKAAGDVQWSSPIVESVEGKVDQPYVRATTVDLDQFDYSDLDGFEGWEIRIVRLTPEPLTSFYKAVTFVDSIVEVYGTKLRYPYSAMVYSQFDARSFSRIPSRAYDTRLIKVKIPNNYNPYLKCYGKSTESESAVVQGVSTGARTNSSFLNDVWSKTVVTANHESEWDGGFAENTDGSPRKVWTDNPAWCFYDLMTNPRYGLGEYIDETQIDKWALYEIGQYCDELVPDTYGGLEPRFTINYLITSREEAFKVLNDLTSIFRGIAYYAQGSIFAVQDKLRDAIYQFNNSNVLQGNFTYSSSSKKARHSVAIVRYNDKRNFFQPAIEYLEDDESVRRYGIREIETTALGATSRGQARRFAKWVLQSEALETETVSFGVGNDGAYLRPGDVIQVYDNFRSPLKYSGRTNAIISGVAANVSSTDGVAAQNGNAYSASSNFNTVTIDQALNFSADKKYKFSLLTPTYNTNTGEAEEIRRSQLQSLTFSGAHTNVITGAYRSDFYEGGSGVCTQISFNSGAQFGGVDNYLNFEDYVITGYTNTGVMVGGTIENMRVATESYSGGCFSGENLIWSVEPDDKDDPEFVSGNYSNYKIINIKEEEDSYSVSALAYSTGKYSEIEEAGNVQGNGLTRIPYFPTGDPAGSSTSTLSTVGTSLTKGHAVMDGSTETVYGTLEVKFPAAGYKLEKSEDDDGTATVWSLVDENLDQLDITYYIAVINNSSDLPTADSSFTNENQVKILPPSRFSDYASLITETIPNPAILGTDSEENSILNKRRKNNNIYAEYLLQPGVGTYWVAVFALSQTSTCSYGMLSYIIPEVEDTQLSSDVGTLTLNNLTTEGIEHYGVDSFTPSGIESVEPGFTWNVSSKGIFSAPEDHDDPRFSLPIDNKDRQYRITIRKPSSEESQTSLNTPTQDIYVEITGYNSQTSSPNFVFQKEYNNPHFITGYRADAHVTGWDAQESQVGTYQSDKEKADWLSVSGSGFNIKNNTNLFPLREFDVVVEAHDRDGNTSAGNKVFQNTIQKIKPYSTEEWNLSNSQFDIFGAKIESPSGIFFAQTTGPESDHNLGLDYSFITRAAAFDKKYPYVASAYIYPNGYFEVILNHATSTVGVNVSSDEEIDRFFNNTAGIVYYYTTGDNTVDYVDGKPIAMNKAASFTLETTKGVNGTTQSLLDNDENIGLQDSITPATMTAAGEVSSPATAFGGLVNLGARTVEVNVHRGYYLFNDSDTAEALRIPFPDISRDSIENIQIVFGYFDDLHVLSAFEGDGQTAKTRKAIKDDMEYLTPEIFFENGINYSSSAEGASKTDLNANTYGQHMVGGVAQSLFLNEGSVLGAGDRALAFRAWGSIRVPGAGDQPVNYMSGPVAESDLIHKILKNIPGEIEIEQIISSEGLTDSEKLDHHNSYFRKIILKIPSIPGLNPNKSAVFVSNDYSQNYGSKYTINEDGGVEITVESLNPYPRTLYDRSDYFANHVPLTINFGIVMTNQ